MKKIRLLPVYEHKTQPLATLNVFFIRLLRSGMLALLIAVAALSIGMLGYHFTEGLHWVDSFLNASMILGGMGPVNEIHTTTGKIFAGCYALFSGIVFLVAAGILLAPVFHRFLHMFHLEGGKK
ncbi:MAG: hypothetical protein M1491_06265 [Deltaproteobacteria bacterium]|nr:hypothetical protein [Deltaproteobacteria bacterium]MCL5276644.1 hypothetical protein [Deltaproteobacteria bacterium]